MRDQGLPEPQLPEHVYNGLQRRLVCDGDGRQVQNPPQLEWRRPRPLALGGAGEQTQRLARTPVPPRASCGGGGRVRGGADEVNMRKGSLCVHACTKSQNEGR